ncbi:hypothetical protein [Bosea sp. (in: a-proteobacteria)]|uniref:hypothetical protein n=1 Tax=Bosea sp. (in: a-proteobacteria) TaxID=1871050 RepID=UPI003567C2E0
MRFHAGAERLAHLVGAIAAAGIVGERKEEAVAAAHADGLRPAQARLFRLERLLWIEFRQRRIDLASARLESEDRLKEAARLRSAIVVDGSGELGTALLDASALCLLLQLAILRLQLADLGPQAAALRWRSIAENGKAAPLATYAAILARCLGELGTDALCHLRRARITAATLPLQAGKLRTPRGTGRRLRKRGAAHGSQRQQRCAEAHRTRQPPKSRPERFRCHRRSDHVTCSSVSISA